MDFWGLVPIAILFLWFGIGVLREPRRFGLGIVLTAALLLTTLTVVSQLLLLSDDYGLDDRISAIILLIILVVIVLVAIVLGVFLAINTLTMKRKEGLGIPALLSGSVGLAILVYVFLGFFAIFAQAYELVLWLVLLGLPASYLAFLFISFLLYSLLYLWGTRRFGSPVDAVVVLGSGLAEGRRVTPLLAGRLNRGRSVYNRSVKKGRVPLMVVSGGRGSDEQLSEAEAMADYLKERGFPQENLVLESHSRDTEQNLEFSAELIRARRDMGKVAVATSDYHAFRAAIIMRKEGIPGYAVGCRTARYYWPSATLREFVAVLVEHSRLNLVMLALLSVPFVLSAVLRIWEAAFG